jgi:hypothetical protein
MLQFKDIFGVIPKGNQTCYKKIEDYISLLYYFKNNMNVKSLKEEAFELYRDKEYDESLKLFLIYLEKTKDPDIKIMSILNSVIRGRETKLMPWLMDHQDNSYALDCIGDISYMNSPQESIEWFERSASMDNQRGIYNLGHCYVYGSDVDKDYKKAASLFLQSGDYYWSKHELGKMYLKGIGVEKDYIKSVECKKMCKKMCKKNVHGYHSKEIDKILQYESLQSVEEFNKINEVLNDTYTFPVTVEIQIEMDKKYKRKTIFKEMHDLLKGMPKVLINLALLYL